MKYLEALKKRELGIDNLPKTLQKKIKELDSQLNALKDIEESEDLQESDLEDIETIKKAISDLDSHIAHKVKIFDQAKYDEKLAKISKMTEAKKLSKEVEQPKEVKSDKVEKSVVTNVVAEEPAKVEVTNTPEAEDDESEYGDSSFDAYYEQGQTRLIEPQYHQATEENEFERHGEGNPKKMTTGLILMGVGAFFLTWGAVNFFKSRR